MAKMAQTAAVTGLSPPVSRQQLRRWKLIGIEAKVVGNLMHSADTASSARQEGVSDVHMDKIKLFWHLHLC